MNKIDIITFFIKFREILGCSNYKFKEDFEDRSRDFLNLMKDYCC